MRRVKLRSSIIRMVAASLLVALAMLPLVVPNAIAGPFKSAIPNNLAVSPEGASPISSLDRKISPLGAGDRVQRSGSRSRDVTGDGWPHIVAREPGINNGTLWVYTHSGEFKEQNTFSSKTLAGTGWNIYNWIGISEVTGDTPDAEIAAEAPADIVARRASDGALLVYPHSGTFRGQGTWLEPVLIGQGWNEMVSMVLADVTTDGFDDILAYDSKDNLWVYPHSGTFNGTSTFLSRVLVRQGRLGWLMATEWQRENPDLVTAFLGTGEMILSPHAQKFNGTNTFSGSRTIATDIFEGSITTSISLIDLNGDGSDDVLKRMPNGYLLAYPFLGFGESTAIGDPALIGQGWQTMDLIT